MQFQYTARSAGGETLSGLLEADSPHSARRQLREQGLFALLLKEGGRSAAAPARGPLFGARRVPRRELMMVTSELAVMCRAGIDVAEALQNVTAHCAHPGLRAALDSVYRDVADGQAVSAALRKQIHVFGETYVASIAAGEASGRVTDVLSRLAEMLKNEIRLQSTLRAVLSYPVVLVLVSSLVLGALIFFVLPQFAKIFEELGIDAPMSTQFLLDASRELQSRLWLWGAVVAGAVVGLFRLARTERVRRLADEAVLRAVLVRDVSRSLLAGRMLRLAGTMLESGVPLLEAIQLCRGTIRNRRYRELFATLEDDVVSGRGIGQTLAATAFIPPGAAQMVITGERTGKLGQVMKTAGEFYEEDGEQRLRELAKLLEPAVIVVMGGIVGFIVMSVMLPIFDFSSLK